MVQQPAEARSLNGVEAPQLSRDAVHEPFMFVLKTKILQDSPRRCLKRFFMLFSFLEVNPLESIKKLFLYKSGTSVGKTDFGKS